jgi:hypothetical protein
MTFKKVRHGHTHYLNHPCTLVHHTHTHYFVCERQSVMTRLDGFHRLTPTFAHVRAYICVCRWLDSFYIMACCCYVGMNLSLDLATLVQAHQEDINDMEDNALLTSEALERATEHVEKAFVFQLDQHRQTVWTIVVGVTLVATLTALYYFIFRA